MIVLNTLAKKYVLCNYTGNQGDKMNQNAMMMNMMSMMMPCGSSYFLLRM